METNEWVRIKYSSDLFDIQVIWVKYLLNAIFRNAITTSCRQLYPESLILYSLKLSAGCWVWLRTNWSCQNHPNFPFNCNDKSVYQMWISRWEHILIGAYRIQIIVTHRSEKNKQGETNNKKWQPPLKSRNFQVFNFDVYKQLNIPVMFFCWDWPTNQCTHFILVYCTKQVH